MKILWGNVLEATESRQRPIRSVVTDHAWSISESRSEVGITVWDRLTLEMPQKCRRPNSGFCRFCDKEMYLYGVGFAANSAKQKATLLSVVMGESVNGLRQMNLAKAAKLIWSSSSRNPPRKQIQSRKEQLDREEGGGRSPQDWGMGMQITQASELGQSPIPSLGPSGTLPPGMKPPRRGRALAEPRTRLPHHRPASPKPASIARESLAKIFNNMLYNIILFNQRFNESVILLWSMIYNMWILDIYYIIYNCLRFVLRLDYICYIV